MSRIFFSIYRQQHVHVILYCKKKILSLFKFIKFHVWIFPKVLIKRVIMKRFIKQPYMLKLEQAQ